MWSPYIIVGLCSAAAIIAIVRRVWFAPTYTVIQPRFREGGYVMVPPTDVRDYYVGYSHIHPNQPDALDSGIWTITAANPDAACAAFLKRCGLHTPKITCCTTDYGRACACLLKPEGE